MTRPMGELIYTIPDRRVELLVEGRVIKSTYTRVDAELKEYIEDETQWTHLPEEVIAEELGPPRSIQDSWLQAWRAWEQNR